MNNPIPDRIHPRVLRPASVVVAIAALLGFQCMVASAATLSWSGGGANNNWNDSGNWGFAGTPAIGDTLVFPAGQPRLTNTNNIVGLTLNQIRFAGAGGGYAIYGNAITITNGIEATNSVGLNLLAVNIALGSPTDFIVNVATGAKLALGTGTAVSGAGGTLSGSVGLIKTGGGTNTLGGGFSNTYGGTTTVTNGLLELNKNGAMAAAIPHDLIIGNGSVACTVRNLAGAEIADVSNVTVNRLCTWDLHDHNETISALTLTGGSVTTGTGTLTLGGNITAIAAITTASISGQLSLGGVTRTISVGSGSASPDLIISANISDGGASAGITKTSAGQMTLSGTNTYTGVTTISGFVIAANDSAFGASGYSTNATICQTSAFLLVQGVDIGNEFLTLADNVDFRSSGTASWAGPITLNGDVLINAFGGTFTNSGVISGSGGFTKGQTGTLILSGSSGNTLDGPVVVNQGVLLLAKSGGQPIPSTVDSLTIGDDTGGVDADVVREAAANQINAGVDIIFRSSGLLDLNNFNDDVGFLTFNGGHITTGTGTVSVNGVVTVNSNTLAQAVIDGRMTLSGIISFNTVGHFFSPDMEINAAIGGSGGIAKDGIGELSLTASNSYASSTTVNDGHLIVDHSNALGSTAIATVVNSGGVLGLRFGVAVVNETLAIAGSGQSGFGALSSSFGSNSWTGDIILTSHATVTVSSGDHLNLSGAIMGGFNLTKGGTGTLQFSGAPANTYTGTTFVNAGVLALNKVNFDDAIAGNLVVGDGSGGADADIVQLLNANQIANTSDLTVNSSGLFDINSNFEGIDTLAGTGNVDVGGSFLNIGYDGGSSTFGGVILGAGQFNKQSGAGTITLSGNNTYTGTTAVNAGALLVNGSQPQTVVTVANAGTLGGSGTIGIVIGNGNITPGTSPGTLTTSNATFSATGDYYAELTGTTPGSGHDQLNVRGTNNLANATLHVVNNFPPGKPSIGDQFVILNNDGAEAITGTFTGLPNNATFNAGDIGYRINYTGGTGNDVVLTVLNAPGSSVTINAADRGWFNDSGDHTSGNLNYLCGESSDGFTRNNWMVFNIPQFAGTIVQAELLINTFSNLSSNPQETYVLRHVSTPIANLVAGGTGLTAIYDDLADGPVYSVRDLVKPEEGQRAIIPLNLTFINDATSAAGGQIALGGSILNLNTNNVNQNWFAFSLSAASDVQLRLTFGTSTLVNATDRGWYSSLGNHTANNMNYFVGRGFGLFSRDFFVFDLPSWSGQLLAAHLSLASFSNASPAGVLSYELHEVATAVSTLTNSASGATGVFADLADGGYYGGRSVFVAEQGTRISVPLGNGFIGAATAQIGNQIALGGSLPGVDANDPDRYLFGFSHLGSGGVSDTQLWLGFVPSTPGAALFSPGWPIALGGNRYQFVISGTAGTTNEVQTSTDLVNWDVVRTIYMTNANATFTYTNSYPNRQFRARLLQ